ncbi:DUF4112 domain-containing protein [Paraglaciecola aestuariivivens]
MSHTPHSIKAPKALLRAQKLANLADSQIRIPIVGIQLGLDFWLGLLPVVGDFIMLLVSLRILAYAKAIEVPKALRVIMLRHIIIDFVLGSLPVVGDLFDLFYKANQKNVRIMEKWWVSQNHADIQSSGQQALKAWLDKQ